MTIVTDFEIGILNDYYGVLLTSHQTKIISMYYDENLSLGEIATIENVSRNAVRDTIVRASEKLYMFEKKLKIVEKISKIESKLTELCSKTDGQVHEKLISILAEMKEI